MSEISDRKLELNNILEKTAEKLQIKNYEINLDIKSEVGDGFNGELYAATIVDLGTNQKIDIVIKKAMKNEVRRAEHSTREAFLNEINFYSVIFPTLNELQKRRNVSKLFSNVPSFFYANNEKYKEAIVLENIKTKGFELREKQALLDEEHAKYIFKIYGQFHALSFALADQEPEKYQTIISNMVDVLTNNKLLESFLQNLSQFCQKAYNVLDSNRDKAVMEKFAICCDNMEPIFRQICKREGKYSTILHGDCWSNNMMFKYDESDKNFSRISDMRILDFQFPQIGSPVNDLSYMFYSSGCKELFDKLYYFLDVYYDSFSSFLKELGSDPEKLYPKVVLKEQWKVYSKFGMYMALLIVKVKLLDKNDVTQFNENNLNKETVGDFFTNSNCDEDLYSERIRDILQHMHEIDAL